MCLVSRFCVPIIRSLPFSAKHPLSGCGGGGVRRRRTLLRGNVVSLLVRGCLRRVVVAPSTIALLLFWSLSATRPILPYPSAHAHPLNSRSPVPLHSHAGAGRTINGDDRKFGSGLTCLWGHPFFSQSACIHIKVRCQCLAVGFQTQRPSSIKIHQLPSRTPTLPRECISILPQACFHKPLVA